MHPELGRLAALAGDWEGRGSGEGPSGSFAYGERLRFWHAGRPYLGYEQRTWALSDGRPLHAEQGYWRAAPGGQVEVVLAHAIGDAEIEVGRWVGGVLRLATVSLQQTPTAVPVDRLERDVWLEGGALRYELRMAPGRGPARTHLRAELRRTALGPPSASLDQAADQPPLAPEELGPDPMAAFQVWYEAARAAGADAGGAMAVATSGVDGNPSARMALLRGLDDRGFVFHTDRRSRKGGELGARPRAALLFHWTRPLHRQVRIEGRVELVGDGESDAYFQSRAPGGRISAWASPQSSVVAGRAELERLWAEARARFPDDAAIQRPPYWGGYRVVPDSVELWQGRQDRLHDRVRFRRAGGRWIVERLAP